MNGADAWHAGFVGAALLLGGAAFHGAWVLPRAGAGAAEQARTRRLAVAALLAAAACLLGWTLAETVTLAGDAGGLPVVLRRTLFGHLVMLQGVALLLAALALRRGPAATCLPAGLLLVLEAAHGHGMAMGRPGLVLVAAGIAHLLAAAVWVGGLPPLLLTVRAAPLAVAAGAARWFSPPGVLAVAVLAASAVVQAAILVGSPAALLATPYGVLVQGKALLFGLLLAGACLNRYRFGPALRGPDAPLARRHLAATILFQTACGIVAIVLAILLGASTPGMDMHRG